MLQCVLIILDSCRNKYILFLVSVKFRGNTVHVCLLLPPVASAPTSVMAVQEGLTSIRVSWSPPTPLGDTTGYRIYYSGSSSGSEDVSDGSTDNLLLTNLVMETSYTISIVATSQHFFSDDVVQEVTLSESIVNMYVWK